MTDEDIVALGLYCENLKSQEFWQVLLSQFETQTVQHFLTTKPDDQTTREHIYASFSGVRDFVGNMDVIIAQKDEILRKSEEAPSDDALEQQDI